MAPARYALNGIQLESELPLQALRGLEVGGIDVDLQPGRLVRLELGSVALDQVHEWELRASGFSFGRIDRTHVIRFDGAMTFAIDVSGSSVTRVLCDRPPTTSDLTVEQMFLDQILPLVLHLSGRFSFHGSAATVSGLAVGFLGDSGRGKSTLASMLASSPPGEPSEALVCDDCLAIVMHGTVALAHASYASARLWPRSADALFSHRGGLPIVSPRSDKRRVELATRREPTVLARLYLLEVGDGEIVIARMRRAAAIFALAKHLFRLEHEGREPLARELEFLDALVSRVPVSTLTYRRDFAELPRVRAAIVADVTSSDG